MPAVRDDAGIPVFCSTGFNLLVTSSGWTNVRRSSISGRPGAGIGGAQHVSPGWLETIQRGAKAEARGLTATPTGGAGTESRTQKIRWHKVGFAIAQRIKATWG